jgi:23S rRNA pseudouridine1911/1915/1917 synthase
MRELKYVVDSKYDNATVQNFLRRGCGVSARLLTRLKRVENGITADGITVRTIDRVVAGQQVVLKLPEDTVDLNGVDIPLNIIYEDEDILVIDKPAGIAVHPSAGNQLPTLAEAAVAYFKSQGKPCRFRPISRLDRNTSGLLLAAKNPHAAHLLSLQNDKFSNKTVKSRESMIKEYLAIVLGRLEGEGSIEQPIRIKAGHGIMREVGDGGKYCLTHWKSLAANDQLSLVRVVIETGRTHQIRVHMAWLGHPLAGDTMYGNDSKHIQRQALHCSRLEFVHPISDKIINLNSPLPPDLSALAKVNRWYF